MPKYRKSSHKWLTSGYQVASGLQEITISSPDLDFSVTNTPSAAFGGALRAPPRPEEGVFFQNSLKAYPYFQNILKICQSMFSKWPQFQVFQVSGFSQGRKMPVVWGSGCVWGEGGWGGSKWGVQWGTTFQTLGCRQDFVRSFFRRLWLNPETWKTWNCGHF